MTLDPVTEPPPFTLLVSEKGGAERKYSFDSAEITLGRVQGNDLVLPKGNVSKRHARILYREGRFIVADLNSTNGTYVNRRRIAQATIVRRNDSVYVGDFVIRVDAGLGANDEQQVPLSTGSGSIEPPGARTLKPDSGESVPLQTTARWNTRRGNDEGARISQVPAPSTSSAPPSRPRGISDAPKDSSNPGQRYSDLSFGHRQAVAATVTQVLEEVGDPPVDPDAAFCERVRQKLEAVVDQLLVAGQIPVGTSAEAVASQAMDEITSLGPLGELLDEPTVSSISAARFDELIGTRDGRQQAFPPGFSLALTFELALKRLSERSGHPIVAGSVMEFRLKNGTQVSIVRGQVSSSGPLMNIRKPRKVASSLDDLVRRGAISRSMATFLSQCVVGHLNILVVGPPDEGANIVLSALCAAASRERIVAATDYDDVGPEGEGIVRLDIAQFKGDTRRILEIASAIPQSRLVATLANTEFAAATLEATGTGMSGLLASLPAANLSRGLLRLPADIVTERDGMSLEAASAWILSSFDLVLEVTRLRDGRVRVLQIGELKANGSGGIAVNDIFRFVVSRVATGGAVEGSFTASGTPPRVATQLQALGMRVDSTLFVRTGEGIRP